jgi:hypothetical protein
LKVQRHYQTKLTNRKNSRKHHSIERLFRKNLGKKTKFVRFMKAINTYFCNRNSDVRLVSTYINRENLIQTIGFNAIQEIFHYSEFMLKNNRPAKYPKTMCLILQNTSYLFRLTVLPKMISRLFWLSRKTNEYLTLSSHRTNCKRTQSCKD